MTYEFEYLMHLFACGSKGLTPHPPRQPVDFDRLILLAQEQSVLPLVGIALSNAPNIGFPSEKVQTLVKSTRSLAITDYIKKRLILKLLGDFEVAGIRAVLLKGYSLADLYAEPNCRISADTDIYVSKKDENKAYNLLREHGCNVIPRSPLSHHAVCEHPRMGHIELHVILYDEFVEDIWFGKMNDRQFIKDSYEKHETQEGTYLTLGKTDNLIFLVLHMIKHFVLSGTSLRQVMDIGLFLKFYQAQIDVKHFWEILESFRYRKLMSTVLSALVLYCGFCPEDFIRFEKQDETTISALLKDLETGGWLGKNEAEERKGSWYMYNRIRYTEKKTSLSYWYYMIKRNVIDYIHSLFPKRMVLARKYPFVMKTIYLVPVAWIYRLLFGMWKILCGRMDTGIALRNKQTSSDDKGRDYLFKLMDMM